MMMLVGRGCVIFCDDVGGERVCGIPVMMLVGEGV